MTSGLPCDEIHDDESVTQLRMTFPDHETVYGVDYVTLYTGSGLVTCSEVAKSLDIPSATDDGWVSYKITYTVQPPPPHDLKLFKIKPVDIPS